MSTYILTKDNQATELCHWGVKGMRWGVRRFQNDDGTLTTAGKKRYGGTNSLVSTQKKKLPFGAKKDGYGDVPHKLPKGAKTVKPDTQLSELEQYKRSQRTKGIVKGVVTTAGVGAAAIAVAPAAYIGWGILSHILDL